MAAAARSVNDARPARGSDGKGRSSARELRLMPSAHSPWRSPGAARKSSVAGCCVRGAGTAVSASLATAAAAALAALVTALVAVLPAAAVCVAAAAAVALAAAGAAAAAAAAAAAGLVEETASWALSGPCGLLTEEAELRRPPGGVGGLARGGLRDRGRGGSRGRSSGRMG